MKKLTLVLFTLSIAAQAQKLPNIQAGSLRAPATARADGKPSEWNNQFQAYNHATEIFYSMANDDHYLYLVVQATNPTIINKIIGGGIQLTLKRDGKKNDKNGVSFTYPVFDPRDRPYINRGSLPAMAHAETVEGKPSFSADPFGKDPVVKTAAQRDSAMNINNKRLAVGSKNIRVSGIKGLDSLISVYNEDGIKAAELFNANLAYTCEIAVDYKKLGWTVNDGFAYHITLNGAPPTVVNFQIPGGPKGDAVRTSDLMASAPTDFWGTYRLTAK